MSESKHTPGPWWWSYSDATFARPIALGNAERDVLTCSEDADGPRGYISPANARLIAAAPDLLEACKALDQAAAHLPIAAWTAAMVTAIDLAREAIRKAEGGQP